jgi:hypothetical protein
MSPQALRVRAKIIELLLRVVQRDAEARTLEAARRLDAEEVGKRADRARDDRDVPPDRAASGGTARRPPGG